MRKALLILLVILLLLLVLPMGMGTAMGMCPAGQFSSCPSLFGFCLALPGVLVLYAVLLLGMTRHVSVRFPRLLLAHGIERPPRPR